MGKKRDDASSDEREQTLNALLAEMSGFQPSDGILVLAATNRVETLDPALTRPGRFDRQIEVGLPGCDERLSILRLHAKNKPLAKEVDLADVAHSTSHFSGASLESLLNEAAILAAQRGAAAIENADLEQAYLRVVAGEDRPGVANAREKRQIAIHEAGHAVARAPFAARQHPCARQHFAILQRHGGLQFGSSARKRTGGSGTVDLPNSRIVGWASGGNADMRKRSAFRWRRKRFGARW